MKKHLFLILFSVIICVNSVFPQRSIRIHEKSTDKLAFSQIFESARFVKLENSTDCVIANIDMLKVDSNRIFAFDNRFKVVFIFNQDGQFIKKIDKKGKGPGEFITLTGFTLDRVNKYVEINDAAGNKALIFDYNGNYIKTIKSVYVRGLEKLNNSNYIGYSYNNQIYAGNKPINSDLIVFNNEGRIVKEFKDIRTIPQGVSMTTFTNLYLGKGGDAYIVPIFEYCLFRVDESLTLEKICDFQFDTKIRKDILSDAKDVGFALSAYTKANSPFMIKGLNVVNDIVNFSFYYKNEEYRTFWKMDGDKTITVNNTEFTNDIALIESYGFRGAFDEGIIDVVQASKFLDSYENAFEADNELSIIQSKKMKTTLSNLKAETYAEDNPILIFYYYK